MSIQDDIDAIDTTKPINPPLTSSAPKPTAASVRANFAAIKNGMQGLLDAIAELSAPSLTSLILTGVDFITSTAITATDSALVAFGKLQAQISLRATLDSPALTGLPTTPTAALGTNTDQISSTAFVAAAIANLVASSPAALDTLNELAAALGNDANFVSTVTTALAGKQDDLISGTNIKTINGNSILGSGDLTVGGGGGGGQDFIKYVDKLLAFISIASTSYVEIFSKTLLVDENTLTKIEMEYQIENRSGSSATYSYQFVLNTALFGDYTVSWTETAALTSHADNHAYGTISCYISTKTTGGSTSTLMQARSERTAALAANTAGVPIINRAVSGSAFLYVGYDNTFKLGMKSSHAGANQYCRVLGVTITQMPTI